MTLKYESEILFDLMKRDGDDAPSDVLPYESELKEKYLNQVFGAYPKLQDYRPEWLNYNLYKHLPADFPVETVSNVTEASFQNVVPYAYKSAILTGQTLVNIVNGISLGTGATEIDNSYILTQTNLVEELNMVLETDLIELNKDYTFIYYIQEKTSTKDNSLVVKYSSYFAPMDNIAITQNIGWNKLKFNVSAFGSNPRLTIAISSSEENGVYFKFAKDKFALLSGDWTQKELPFDTLNCGGMLSVKMPVLTTTNEDGTKTNILTVNEDVTLRGVGDVKDTLDCLKGQVTKRIEEIVLDGSESWLAQSDSNWNNDTYISFKTEISDMNENAWGNGRTNCISNKFKTIALNNESYKASDEFIGTDGVPGYPKYFNIKLLRSRLNGTETIDGFKQWLSQNPITIQYVLATPTIKTVDLTCTNEQGETIDFMPLEGVMHVETSSDTLPPLLDMEVPVEAINQNLASFIEG